MDMLSDISTYLIKGLVLGNNTVFNSDNKMKCFLTPNQHIKIIFERIMWHWRLNDAINYMKKNVGLFMGLQVYILFFRCQIYLYNCGFHPSKKIIINIYQPSIILEISWLKGSNTVIAIILYRLCKRLSVLLCNTYTSTVSVLPGSQSAWQEGT